MDNCFVKSLLEYLSIINKKNVDETTTSEEFEIRFIKTEPPSITINSIYLVEFLRNKGIFRDFLHFIIDQEYVFMDFWIVDVLSKQLYNYLLKFNYKGWRFKLNRDGFHLKKIN